MYSRYKKHDGIMLLLCFLTVTAASLPLFFPATSYKGDSDYIFSTFEALRKTIVEYGEFPYWNPWYHGGVPLLANTNASVFSIELLCVLLFGTFYGLRIAVFCYGLLASFGMYLFLGDYTKNAFARFYGACVFSLAGCFSLHIINGHFVFLGFAWLPLLLWFVRRLGKAKCRYAVGAGFVAGMLLNHNIHYTSLFSFLTASVMALPVLFRHWKESPFRKNVILAAATVFAVGGYRLLVSVDFLLDYPRELETIGSIHPKNLLFAFVAPFQDPWWVLPKPFGWDWHELGCYIGVFSLFLVFWSFLKKIRWFHFAILLTAVLSLNSDCRYLPGYWLRKLPAFSSCWVITRWRFVLLLFLALAASAGFTALIRQKNFSKIKLILLMFFSVSMIVANQFWTYAYSVQHKSEKDLMNGAPGNPAGGSFVTMALSKVCMYGCIRNNIGNLASSEVNLGYHHDSIFGHYSYGSKRYFGEFFSPDAKMTHWSPNRIEFYAERPTKVRINSNTGNYWRSNGIPLFPSQRAFEEEGIFILDVAEPGLYVLSAVPRIHSFALYLSLCSALLVLIIIFFELRKPVTGKETPAEAIPKG